jgi:hypothetical protein
MLWDNMNGTASPSRRADEYCFGRASIEYQVRSTPMTRARFFACILFVLIGKAAHAAQCDFQFWFDFKGTKIYRNPAHTAYLYATDHSRIDADGAPNAYHPDDIGKNCLKDPHRGLDCPANAGYPKTRWWPQVLVPDPNDALRVCLETKPL